jgi:hypothetical protein
VLYALGFASAIAVGAALPLMTIVFGNSTAQFNQQATGQDNSSFTSNINNLVLYLYTFSWLGLFLDILEHCVFASLRPERHARYERTFSTSCSGKT